MLECLDWMLDDSQWSRIPKPYEAWNHIGWFIVTKEDKGTEEQNQFFDFSFAMMLQKETGWN